MINQTLTDLENWHNSGTLASDRLKLLSKLSILELCGWLEVEFDRLVGTIDRAKLNDPAWVESNVIKRTSGFRYRHHLRSMVVDLIGEIYARRVELHMEQNYPAELGALEAKLETLWGIRCGFAHADIHTNIVKQQQFQAPSWVKGEYQMLKTWIIHYEASLGAVVSTI